MKQTLGAVWAYRGFVLGSVRREFESKYRNSLMGAAWNVINPLSMILVYTLVFTEIMKSKLPGVDSHFAYSIYLCAGILNWGLFAEIVSRSQTMFIENANLLKKVSFPRLCLPVIVVINALVNFGIVFGLFTVLLLMSGDFPGWPYLALIPLTLLLSTFAIGLGVLLGVLNVFFRDVGHFFGIFITFLFWLTPIVYPVSVLPEEMKTFMALNPLALLVAAIQGILVESKWPNWNTLIYPLVLTILFCLTGLRLFRTRVGEMVDEL